MEEVKNETWNQPQQPQYRPENKKVAAGILAILLGWLGVHKFILGYTKEGVLLIVFSIISCGIAGSLIGLIEGIVYLTKTDEEFYQTYQVNKKGWF
jgi:TM2 domain-containing membrane protein YozV